MRIKIIFKITKNELRNLFYSPVAWFLTIAFMVQCAVFFMKQFAPLAKWQELLLHKNAQFADFGASLTRNVFLNADGIFNNVMQNLYLFIPLLTMGLMSREINSGSIKLLYSSPVNVRQIVFGKFLAMMIYNLLLLMIVGVFIITGFVTIQHVDFGILLSAALGFYLLVCAYTAIGLFMSSLSTYQIVSAIGSFIIIFILSRIGGLWQKYDFVRDLTYFLSMSGRTIKMLNGLITTKDVFYFLVVVYMFVGFTLVKLQNDRSAKSWYIKASRYIVVFVVALTLGYISDRPFLTGYWDTSAQNVNTLHPNIQRLVKELGDDEPLEVTVYTNLLGKGLRNGLPQNRNNYLSSLWDRYLRFRPGIKFDYVYYYDRKPGDSSLFRQYPGKSLKEIAAQMADGYDTPFSMYEAPEQIHKTADLGFETDRVILRLKYKGKIIFLRTFDDAGFWPNDQQIAAALQRLLKADLPGVAYITGDLERSIYKTGEREYSMYTVNKTLRSSLVNQGFNCDTVLLDQQNISPNAAILVLADPKTALSNIALEKIKAYIHNGGNMFILGEPNKQELLNPLLEGLGVRLMPGTLVQPTRNDMPQMIRPYLCETAIYLADEPALRGLRVYPKEKNASKSVKILTPGAVGIAYTSDSGFTINPLLATVPGQAFNKAGLVVADSANPVFTPSEGDTRQMSYPVVVQLTRKVNNKEQRIVVCGDADFMSNLRQGGNFLGTAMYSWLDNNLYPIYTPYSAPLDTLLRVSLSTATILQIMYIWILPAIVLLLGTVLLIRRARQ